MQIAVDRDHGDEDGKPQAERQDDAWRKRAGAVNVGNGEPNDRRARARQAARGQDDERRHQAQQHEYGGRGRHEHRSDAPVIGELDREHRKHATEENRCHDIAPARPA